MVAGMAGPLRVGVRGGWSHVARHLLKRGTSGKPDEKEQTSARQLGRSRTGWAEVVKAAEAPELWKESPGREAV